MSRRRFSCDSRPFPLPASPSLGMIAPKWRLVVRQVVLVPHRPQNLSCTSRPVFATCVSKGLTLASEMTMQHELRQRLLCCLSGFALCAIASFALGHLIFARPFAPLCSLMSALGLALGVHCFRFTVSHRRMSVAALLGIGSTCLFWFVLAPFVPATSYAWMNAHMNHIRSVMVETVNDGHPHLDGYGGRYHVIQTSTNEWTVYSDGPDHKDDGGRIQIADKLRTFEGAFSQAYPTPFSLIRQWVREAAIRECTWVWHSFDGDIVWSVSEKGIAIKGSQQAP